MGSGKTILTAGVIAHLMSECSSKDVVSYFFCQSDDAESLQVKTIFGSIARQLLGSLSKGTIETVHEHISSNSVDEELILQLLRSSLSPSRQHFIVLDGLDECDIGEARKLVEMVASLQSHIPQIHVKVFFSSRPHGSDWIARRLNSNCCVAMDEAKINRDIDRYIDATLEQRLENEELHLGDPKLILHIQQALSEGAQGMLVTHPLYLNVFLCFFFDEP